MTAVTVSTPTTAATTGPAVEVATDLRCEACPHPAADHDAIALRFCRATVAAALERGCVCSPA